MKKTGKKLDLKVATIRTLEHATLTNAQLQVVGGGQKGGDPTSHPVESKSGVC